jgi:fibronectin-binding autotransporter adhesin
MRGHGHLSGGAKLLDRREIGNKDFYMNPTQGSRMKLIRHLRSAALAGGSLALVSPLAAQLSWDGANTADATFNGGGAGVWNTTNLNWGNADLTANVAWSSGSAAVFGGTGGTVTVGEAVSASSLSFNSNGYALTVGATNNVLTLTGGRVVSVAENITATITSNLLANAGGPIAKQGPGTLFLNGQSNTGGWAISGGTVIATSFQSFGATNTNHAVSLSDATIDIRRDSGNTSHWMALTVSGNSTLLSSRATAGSGQANGSTGGLSIGNATLNLAAGTNVNSNTAYSWRFGDTTGTDTISLTGNAMFHVSNNGTGTGSLIFASNAPINDGGAARTITKDGTGTLRISSTAASLVAGTNVLVQQGRLWAEGAGALGAQAAVTVASGANFEFGVSNGAGVSNTVASLSGAGVVTSANNASSSGTNNLTISSSITPGGAGALGTLSFNTVNPAGAATVSFGEGMTLAFDLGAAGASDQIRFLNYSAGELLLNPAGHVIHFTNLIGDAAAGQTYTLFTFFSDGIGATAVASGLGSGLTIGSGLEAFEGSVLNFGANSVTLTVGSTIIPEPGAFALLAGFAGLGFAATRRRRAGSTGA